MCCLVINICKLANALGSTWLGAQNQVANFHSDPRDPP